MWSYSLKGIDGFNERVVEMKKANFESKKHEGAIYLSYDFAVWYTDKVLTNVEAEALYKQLCDGGSNLVTPHSAIEDFYKEITSLYPEINNIPEDEIDNIELCPWSTEFDKSQGHILMSCVWSRAEYVKTLIIQLALKHKLAFYDPQLSIYTFPYMNEI